MLGVRVIFLKPLLETCFFGVENFLPCDVKDYYDICLGGGKFMRDVG